MVNGSKNLYMECVLQLFMHLEATLAFYEKTGIGCTKEKQPISTMLASVFTDYYSDQADENGAKPKVSILHVFETLEEKFTQKSGDVIEVLKYILDQLKAEETMTYLDEFSISIDKSSRCQRKHITKNEAVKYWIQLNQSVSVQQSLDDFFAQTITYTNCKHCKSIYGTRLYALQGKLPPIMFLMFKVFNDKNQNVGKSMYMDNILEMGQYHNDDGFNDSSYELHGWIRCEGTSLGSSEYELIIKKGEEWIKIGRDEMKPVTKADLKAKNHVTQIAIYKLVE